VSTPSAEQGRLGMHYPTRWTRALRRPCTWRTSSAIRLTTFGITDTSCGPPNENTSGKASRSDPGNMSCVPNEKTGRGRRRPEKIRHRNCELEYLSAQISGTATFLNRWGDATVLGGYCPRWDWNAGSMNARLKCSVDSQTA
jgi:hypothetical protein